MSMRHDNIMEAADRAEACVKRAEERLDTSWGVVNDLLVATTELVRVVRDP